MQKLNRLDFRSLLVLAAFSLAAFSYLGKDLHAATATATPTLTVTIQAAATLTTPNVTFTPPGTSNFTGNYTGTSALTFSLRTAALGGAGNITVQGTSNFVGANGGTGPSLNNADLSYACAAGDLTGGGGLTGTLTFCNGSSTKTILGTPSNVLTGIGAKSTANGAVLNVNWSIPDSSSFQADTYTGTVTFTVTAT